MSPSVGGGFSGFRASLGGEKRTETQSSQAIGDHAADTVFTNVCAAIANQKIARDGILVVVDEFDQIRDSSGMAGLLKSLATNAPSVKFCIVGVAQDIYYLMREHESSDRLFAGGIIRLQPMGDDELKEIIRLGERSIDGLITFSGDADSRLVELAHGHPYMVHLVGKYALRRAYQNGSGVVLVEDVDAALHSIASREADPVLEGRYKKAVGSSPQRETVLKSMARVRSSDGECWTTKAYPIATGQGVENPSQYVGQLVIDEYGAELEKERERYYRFRDSLFAAYVEARPRLHSEPPDQ